MRRNVRKPLVAVVPGSFDPITNGHIDIIERALEVSDAVVVGILVNRDKAPLFDVEERVAIVRDLFRASPAVSVRAFEGLLVDFARAVGARLIVRGIRAVSDYEYELQMALMNRRLAPEIETVFLLPKEEYSFLSSRLVKEVFAFGGNVRPFVPPRVARALATRFEGKRSRKAAQIRVEARSRSTARG